MTKDSPVRILILGASGMLGNTLLRFFAASPGFDVVGAVRRGSAPADIKDIARVITGIDVENSDALTDLFTEVRPDVVINCVGIIKHLDAASSVLKTVPINTMLPHRLVQLCALAGARLVHVSTDCVFTGDKGDYLETDPADATDVYGLSKYLGEVDAPHAITIRTSIIGHELDSARGLIGWFLSQDGDVDGYTKAIFSGLPTVELARVIRDIVLPRPDLHGLWHVSAEPIAKYDLLRLTADAYGRTNAIRPSDRLVIDRSLNSQRFRTETGYSPPSWPDLIRAMKDFG